MRRPGLRRVSVGSAETVPGKQRPSLSYSINGKNPRTSSISFKTRRSLCVRAFQNIEFVRFHAEEADKADDSASWTNSLDILDYGQCTKFFRAMPCQYFPCRAKIFRAKIFRAGPCHKSPGPPVRAVPEPPCPKHNFFF